MIGSPHRDQRRTRTAGAVWDAPFPFTSTFQNGPRRQGFAPPRSNRAPLTAPGRSEKSPQRRERGQTGNQQTLRLPLVGSEPNPLTAPNFNRRDTAVSAKIDTCLDASGMVKLLCPA
jgi:hypothetical protein